MRGPLLAIGIATVAILYQGRAVWGAGERSRIARLDP